MTKGMQKTMTRIFRRIISFITLLIGLTLFAGIVLIGVCMYFNAPPAVPVQAPALGLAGSEPRPGEDGIRPGNGNEVFIEVRKGESAQSVGRRLEHAGLIRSRHFWYFLCRFDREFIKSGTYLLETPASQMAIHRVLVSGKQLLQRVTIPEGVTLKKTAKILEDAGICTADEFLTAAASPEFISRYGVPNATLEGYLFPDTYLFPADYPAAQAVRAMADTFFEKLKAIDSAALGMSPGELNRRVIIASIVEREYRVDEEAPLMAGVFYNRLTIGMALQSCATVEYIITEIQGRPHPEVLYTRDTEIRDPYNTYIMPGLPPGPISAPGAVALNAAFYPAPSDYLYFRLTDAAAGRHYFSRTLDDHIRAGQLYVKGR
ncbi:hypothetical protein AGMMS50293_25360 [Spirochaetia bacterium]|nr:hypothetical protein AGMMS50293_25360 [Spirochaetia bacterium]